LPELQYPERFNCVTELVDRWLAAGRGGEPCLLSMFENLSYAELAKRVNRIANVLTHDLRMVPGDRVLLRAPNNPMMVAAYLAVVKAGGRRRGRHHAAPAREGDRLPACQGEGPLCLVRRATFRRDGESQGGRPRARARGLLGRPHARCPREADEQAGLRDLCGLRHRER